MAAWSAILFLFVIFGLAYFQASRIIWVFTAGLSLILLTLYSPLGFLSLSFFWVIFIAAALFATLGTLRRRYFTAPLIQILQKRMPPLGDTEREAIEAGNVWWEKELFCGRPHWKKLLTLPKPQLSAEEQAFLDNQVDHLCEMLEDWQIVRHDSDLPQEAWRYLKQERFFGMVIPKEYGGLGFSALAHSTVVMKISTRCISAAVTAMVPNSLGPGELLLHYGTTEQKNYYLPRLASGEEIPCFGLTAPEAGSDAASLTDSGVVCQGDYQGKQVLGIRLNWDKRYITLAPVATVLGLAFRLYDPDHLLGGKIDIGITLCLVPASHPGVETGRRHLPLHLAFMNGPTRGKDVFIPIDWIIGGPLMAGQGWKMLMECLSIGRSVSLPALSTACGKLTYRMTGAYARLRRQFNTNIANFEGVEESLSEIAGSTYLLEACRVMTAGAVDQKIKPAIASAIAKYNMTEIARKVIAHAMDIHAGQGIQVGPRNFLAHAHMAIPVSITVEGANILTRNLIIFGQGAVRCHPYVLSEIQLLTGGESPNRVKQLDRILLSHAGYFISNIVRSFWLGLTRGKLVRVPLSGPIAPYYRQLTRMSAALALLADTTMLVLGGALKRKESISARLGDILSQLYLASTVLKYYHDHNETSADINYVKWCIEKCLFDIQTASDDLLNNFPSRGLAKLLRMLIFPWGRSYQKPKDTLSHLIVATMLEPSDFRDRLTCDFYMQKKEQDPIYRMETAFKQAAILDPILKKFHKALHSGSVNKCDHLVDQLQTAVKTAVLTNSEADSLRHFYELYAEVIQVNEFSFNLDKVLA